MEATCIVSPYGLPLEAPFCKPTCKRNLGLGGRIKRCRKGLNFIWKKKKNKKRKELDGRIQKFCILEIQISVFFINSYKHDIENR